MSKEQERVTISEKLVREIAANLGASAKLEEAVVEQCFGQGWTEPPPEGFLPHTYANRDRLVAHVVIKMKDLWTFQRD